MEWIEKFKNMFFQVLRQVKKEFNKPTSYTQTGYNLFGGNQKGTASGLEPK